MFGLWNEVVHHLTLQACQINYYSNLRFGDFCRPCSLIQPSSGSPWYAPIQPAPDSPASTYRFPKTPGADRFCSTVTEVGSSTISLHWSWLCWYFTFNCKWVVVQTELIFVRPCSSSPDMASKRKMLPSLVLVAVLPGRMRERFVQKVTWLFLPRLVIERIDVSSGYSRDSFIMPYVLARACTPPLCLGRNPS